MSALGTEPRQGELPLWVRAAPKPGNRAVIYTREHPVTDEQCLPPDLPVVTPSCQERLRPRCSTALGSVARAIGKPETALLIQTKGWPESARPPSPSAPAERKRAPPCSPPDKLIPPLRGEIQPLFPRSGARLWPYRRRWRICGHKKYSPVFPAFTGVEARSNTSGRQPITRSARSAPISASV